MGAAGSGHEQPRLLVLDGLLVRGLQLGVMPSPSCSAGDVLRPWEEGLAPDLLPALSHWKVLQPARLALLDRRANAVIGRWPELNAATASRLRLVDAVLAVWMGRGSAGTAIGINVRDLSDLSNTLAPSNGGGLCAGG